KDQSIYSFRHANPEGIDDFKNHHPTTHDESLVECGRCPICVVEIADHLIRNNYPSSTSSRLQASPNNENGKIHIVQWKNSSEEVKGVAKYVIHLVNDKEYAPEDILIITPRSKIAHKIQDEIKNIPVHSFYYKKALEKPLAQCAFTLLAILNNKEDRVALRWWLGKDSTSGRRCAYQKLREYCEKENRSPRDVLEAISQKKLDLPGTNSLLKPFKELNKIITRISIMNMHDLIDELLPNDNDDCKDLREIAERALENAENIHELYGNIMNSFIRPEVPNSGHVRIMSPQSAKGQTSKVVIVTSCIEGLLPFIDSTKPLGHPNNNIDEQRRIFYVAITRCTKVLMLSSFIRIGTRYARDANIRANAETKFSSKTIASQFLSELGPSAPPAQTGSEWQDTNYKTSES
ncbi:MAG: ATP-dependent helicase, partial [Thaumarchaeota archaeon]|nr:ATP-dependent helicase [Nitrososphaerota archaeon]